MSRTKHTEAQRAEALELLAAVGKAEASRRTGIPAGTIASWGHRDGVRAPGTEAMRPVIEAAQASVAVRKAALVEGLLDDITRLRDDLYELDQSVVVVTDEGAVVHPVKRKATPTERKATMTAIAIAVDKVQVLTGEPSSIQGNIEQTPRAELVERVGKVLDELGQRRSAA